MNNTFNLTTPSDLEIVVTRDFDASLNLVWQAMTKPELLKRWLTGPPGWEMVICENDLQAGGAFRHVWSIEGGSEMSMHGTYDEVTPMVRMVRLEKFEFGGGVQIGEQHATAILNEIGGKTKLTITLRYANKEARDAALVSGMEDGMAASYTHLDDLLASQ